MKNEILKNEVFFCKFFHQTTEKREKNLCVGSIGVAVITLSQTCVLCLFGLETDFFQPKSFFCECVLNTFFSTPNINFELQKCAPYLSIIVYCGIFSKNNLTL